MALRNLLRRIPVRSISAPRMWPAHGVSPATAAAAPRFVATRSEFEQRHWKASYMEQRERAARISEIIEANFEKARKENDKLLKVQAVVMENVRRDLADLSRYGRNWRIFGTASSVVMQASAWLLIYVKLKHN